MSDAAPTIVEQLATQEAEAKLEHVNVTELYAKKRQKDRVDCAQKIDAILKEHKCTLVGIPQMVPAGNGAWVTRIDVMVDAIKEG